LKRIALLNEKKSELPEYHFASENIRPNNGEYTTTPRKKVEENENTEKNPEKIYDEREKIDDETEKIYDERQKINDETEKIYDEREKNR